MPVSLCEWRVRIGTFVHWIRDCEIKERKERLLKERIRRMKILCERLKAKMDDSEKDSEDGENVGKTRHDISNPRKSNQCPHKTTDIKSPGDSSYIKDLLASCDQCIQDLLTQNYSNIEKVLTQSDTSTEHLLGQNDSCLKDLLSVPNSSRNHQHKASGASLEELMQNDSKIKKLITQSDSSIKFLLNSLDSGTDDMLLSAKSCRNYQPVLSDSAVNDLFSRADSDSRISLVPSNTELKMQSDSHVQDLLKPRDTSINELLTPRDSYVNELRTPIYSPRNVLPRPRHSSFTESLTPRDCSISELLTPQDSSVNDTHEGSLISELLMPRDSYVSELQTPRNSPRSELPMPRHLNAESVTPPRDCSIKELLTVSDSSISELLAQEDSLIKELLTPKDPAVYEVLTPNDSSLDELPIPRDSSIKESLMPTDSSFTELLKPTDASINELMNPTDSSVNELLTPRDFPINASLTPRDSNVRKLLTLREEVLHESDVKVHEPKKDFCNEEMVSEELKILESSHACKRGQLIGVGSESPLEWIKHDDSSWHRPRFPLSASTSESDSNVAQNELQKTKEISNESSKSSPLSCLCTWSLDAPVDGIYNPCLAELLLAKAGDVELNPGPLHGSIDRVLQESELILLAKEVPGNCYTRLCIGLGFSYTESQNVLTKHLMDIPGALIEFLCRWKLKQRDDTDCRAVLAGILGKADIGALQTKLLAGGYRRTETSPSAPDTPQPLIDMTEEQVVQCGHDLQAFYREQMCKIKTDPLDFSSVLEFEKIYTNLTLLKSKTQLDYTALLTTEVNGAIPKRLMVEGEGGVGKTTFCSKIAWDWVSGSPQFEQFSWVVVIPLRKIAKGQTIGEIVKNYLSDRNTVTPYQINNYILSEPAKVLIVLDGLDEYDGDLAAEEHSDIAKILRSEKFKECIVLVTTRPWRADQIKSNDDLSRKYAFIGVKGFSPENISSYIKKYFVKDKKAGSELIRYIEVNDVIKENMAPFPIYVAMLCILWKNSDSEKRETMRRLKTFSQLFEQMIMFLRDHYVSKLTQILHEAHLGKEMENINSFLLEMGPIAMKGLLSKRLTFNEQDFISCTKAMETCCRIGVLTRDKQNISRWERKLSAAQSVTTCVFFPHKLFQEYISALYLASLYGTDRKKYDSFLDRVMDVANPEEFRYLLYFTAAQGKDVGLDIVEKIQQNKVENYSYPDLFTSRGYDTGRAQRTRGRNDFLVDITFEAYNKDTAKSVGRRIFAEDKILTIDEDMSAHTMSGYLFIMEQHGMETLIFRGRSCGPTVSRDLADVLCSSSSLLRLEFYGTTLDEDLYRLLQDRASSAGVTSLKELYVDHQFLGDLQRFRVTVGDLFPSLKQLELTTLQTVTPGVVEWLTHPNLSVLSIKADSTRQTIYRDVKEREGWPVPLIGEPASLGQLFSSSFPQLTSLSFKGLVIGNKRCEAILRSLRNYKNMKSTSFISCFTDDELDFLARRISKENRIAITLDHDLEQTKLTCEIITADLMDALCHRTCIRELCIDNKDQGVMARSREWFSEVQGIEVDSKIQTFTVKCLELHDDQSASCCLRKFICLLPCLTDLTIWKCFFHDEFYKEIADLSSSSKIQTFEVSLLELHDDQSASCCLGKLICLLPCLTDLTIHLCFFHDEFYKEIADHASSSKIQTITVMFLELRDDQSASCCLGRFICLLPCLTDLKIAACFFHDEFYKEIANRASSSKIQTFVLSLLELRDDQSASCCLGKFICLLPCLTDLKIGACSFHDEFYKEIADRASSSSKIQTFTVKYLDLCDDQSASCCLGRFICLLPCLTDLRIEECSIHDEFYKEIVDRASTSKIQILVMSYLHGLDEAIIGQSASKQLARFLCSLPCLADLTLEGYDLHDDFYTEITSLAASSQNPYFRNKKHMGMLEECSERKDRCQQQQLNQHHQAVIPAYQHSPRSWEQLGPNILQPRQSAQPSLQYQNDHQRPIQSEHQQVHQLRNAHESWIFLHLGSYSSHPWPSPQSYEPYQNDLQRRIQSDHHQVHQFTNPHGSFQELRPFHPLQSPQSSAPYQSDHQTCIQSEHEQVQHLLSDLQESTQTPFQPITEHDQLTKTHLNEFDRYFRWYVSAQHNTCNSQASQYTAESSCQGPKQRSLHSGHIDTTQDTSVRHEQIDAIQTHNDDCLLVSSSEYINSCTSLYRGGHSIGMKPMYEYDDDDPDRPSTSGLSSAGISIGSSPWEGERIPSHQKRIHSDSDGDCDDNGGVGVGGNEDDGGVGDGGNDDDGGDNGNTSTTAESLERRPRKRRAKTDRNPASP